MNFGAAAAAWLFPTSAAAGGALAATAAFVINVGLALGASKVFGPKPPKLSTRNVKNELTGRTLNTRGPSEARQYVYGEVRVGGFKLNVGASGNGVLDIEFPSPLANMESRL